MNLTKYFNFNYLKENIKKSKGMLALFILAIPFFTILTIVLTYSSKVNLELLDIKDIIFVNIIGMYIIPIGISFCLFGYVYKKTSIDFINSMPINRKSIFITNTIGGIIIITIIQLLTMLATLLIGAIKTNLEIIPAMILDTAFMMWISYVFVFLVTNLAMTLSGTHFTQIVLTVLFIFFIPITIQLYENISEEIFYENYEYNGILVAYEMKHHILPYDVIIKCDYEYSNISILKMSLLGIGSFILGIYLFHKKKMENAEESFGKDNVHLFVKGLTIFPMILLLNLMEEEFAFYILAIGIIAVYYFIYDYIVRKKVKFIKSLFVLILILVISQGIVFGMKTFPKESLKETINNDNISEIAIVYEYDNYSNIDIFTDNKEVIKLLFDSIETANQKREENNETNIAISPVSIIAKAENGKKYSTTVDVIAEDLYTLIDLLEKDEDYMNKIKQENSIKGFISVSEYNSKDFIKDSEKIQTQIEKELNNKPLWYIYENVYGSEVYLEKYYYKNHNLKTKKIPIDINKDVLKIVADYENEKVSKIDFDKLDDSNYGTSYCICTENGDGNLGYDRENYEYFGNYFGIAINDIEKFVKENKDEKIDETKKCYIIFIRNENNYYLFTNKIDELNAIIEKEIASRDVEENMYID